MNELSQLHAGNQRARWPGACAVAALLGAAGCASSLGASAAELALTSHPLAGDHGAVILERRASVILDYTEDTNDRTGARYDFKAAVANAGGGGAAAAVTAAPGMSFEDLGSLADVSVSSYSLEIVQRTKIFAAAGAQNAGIDVPVPSDATLGEVEGATYLPSGEVIPLRREDATVGDGHLKVRVPRAEPGAVVALRAKVFSDQLRAIEWSFSTALPAANSTFRVKARASSHFRFAFRSPDRIALPEPEYVPTASRVQGEDYHWVVWQLRDVPATAMGPAATTISVGG